jgi:hypothetical protein
MDHVRKRSKCQLATPSSSRFPRHGQTFLIWMSIKEYVPSKYEGEFEQGIMGLLDGKQATGLVKKRKKSKEEGRRKM